jgi:chemotaxis protein CheY-P-specific phosphatase CheC
VNAVSAVLNLDKEKILGIVKQITGNENIRGEDMDVKEFSAISDLINQQDAYWNF